MYIRQQSSPPDVDITVSIAHWHVQSAPLIFSLTHALLLIPAALDSAIHEIITHTTPSTILAYLHTILYLSLIYSFSVSV